MVLLIPTIINIFVEMRYLILLFFIVSCQYPERDCLNFQTGTFEFESISLSILLSIDESMSLDICFVSDFILL